MDKIKNVAQRLGIITVEDMERYTALELIMMIANKMNDYNDELQDLSDKVQYLLNDGTLEEVVQIFDAWLQDGTFDTLINQTALKEVNDRVDETNAQLEHKVNKTDFASEIVSRRVRGENSIDSPAGTFDSANFAGQNLGKKAPIGNVFHHYTDGKCIQIDNVGEGNVIVTMVNANNPTRRADKPNTFFGSGYYLQLMTNNPNTEEVYSHFVIDENGNPFWNGVKPSGSKNNTTTFKNGKDDLSLPCFEFVPINKHQRPYSYENGSGRVLYYVEENGSVCSIATPLEYIELKGTNARIVGTEIALVGESKSKGINGDLRELQLREVGARSGYNTDNIKVGTMIFDNTLNKPLWWDGFNWRDANGSIV